MSERLRGISPCATPRRTPAADVQIAFGIPEPVLFAIHIGAIALWQKEMFNDPTHGSLPAR